ncbi:hypothetical protein ASE01_04150 [Nocardioides sp. Root190]|uniref:hypothetical protein n=1 Tax=Nocardioides sp. Root190 TaxID=1736488 RepID=UPI0006FE9522|nr:hypothetical protein [Nocardioides sp. Root190]KRB78463.1 hypothetical protein ASE01_04150 [Nocardioides sp. Root190]
MSTTVATGQAIVEVPITMDRRDSPTPEAMPQRSRAFSDPGVVTRTVECLSCGSATVHVKGRVTHDRQGGLLVQWWDCTACEEGEAV